MTEELTEMLDIQDDGTAKLIPQAVDPAIARRRHRDEMIAKGLGFEWALTNKPGVNVVNGGRKRAYAKHHSKLYQRFEHDKKKENPRFKLGRYTRPIPKVAPNQVEDVEPIVEVQGPHPDALHDTVKTTAILPITSEHDDRQ